MKIVRNSLLALAAFIAAGAAGAQGRLENPADGGYASGIALISGWHCDADRITLRVDDGSEIEAAYGTSRRDTLGVCGDSDNGYGFLVNYSNIGPGRHQVEAFADGVRFDAANFTVTTYGPAFLRRPTVAYVLPGFPAPEDELVVSWSEAQQGFVAAGYDPTSVPLDGSYAFHRCTVGFGPTVLDSSRGDFTVSGTFEISGGRYTQNVTINGERFRDTGRIEDRGDAMLIRSDYGAQGVITLISRGGLLQTYISMPDASEIDHWVATDGAAIRSKESSTPRGLLFAVAAEVLQEQYRRQIDITTDRAYFGKPDAPGSGTPLLHNQRCCAVAQRTEGLITPRAALRLPWGRSLPISHPSASP